MTLQEALAQSNLRMQMAIGKDSKGREIVAAMKNCGTRATGYHHDYRVILCTTDPTTKRKLTAAELAATNWQPAMRQAEWQ